MVALGPEDCGTAMDPSSGGRVVAEPTVGTWLECSENPAAAAAVVGGKGGGAGANAVEDAAYGSCAACWAIKWRCDGCRPWPVGATCAKRTAGCEPGFAAVIAEEASGAAGTAPVETICASATAFCELGFAVAMEDAGIVEDAGFAEAEEDAGRGGSWERRASRRAITAVFSPPVERPFSLHS